MTHLNTHTHALCHRNLASNELPSLPDDTFDLLHVNCSINITSNPCAQQPCSTGLQWFQAKQGIHFCASGLQPVTPGGAGTSSDPGGPGNSSNPGNSGDPGDPVIPPPGDDDFPWVLVGGIAVAAVLVCAGLAWLLWRRRRGQARAFAKSRSLSREELSRTTVNPVAKSALTNIQLKVLSSACSLSQAG